MYPYPIILGPISLNLYGLMVASGVLAGLALFSLTAPRRNLPPSALRDFCFWMILAGLIGSRIAHVIVYWSDFSGDPWSALAYWEGGLMFQGGLISALLVSPFFLRYYLLRIWPTADVIAPSLALGQSLGRLGCFFVGCCYGQSTDLGNACGVVFPHGSLAPVGIPLWPTQIFESVGLFVLALVLFLALKSKKVFWCPPGRVAAFYLFGAGLLRLAMESLRGDYRGYSILFGFPSTTVAAMLSTLVGLILLFLLRPITVENK